MEGKANKDPGKISAPADKTEVRCIKSRRCMKYSFGEKYEKMIGTVNRVKKLRRYVGLHSDGRRKFIFCKLSARKTR